MSFATNYKISFGNKPVHDEVIERISEISVSQEMNMIWEAYVTLTMTADETGSWDGLGEDFTQLFSPIRIELKNNDSLVPLIDGPLVTIRTNMSAEPGQSSIILGIYDDSVYLNLKDECLQFEGKKDSEIASEIFEQALAEGKLGSIDVDNTDFEAQSVFFRGTRMQLLRRLAKRNNMYASVLPGESPGESIACFKHYPEKPEPFSLQTLILLGEKRNIITFDANIDGLTPSKVQAASVDPTNKKIKNFNEDFRNFKLYGEVPILENENYISLQFVPHYKNLSRVIERNAATQAEISGYAIDAEGTVQSDAYPDILIPYNMVTCGGVNSFLSGDYLINSVEHKITRSTYSQSFKLIRNAFTKSSQNIVDALRVPKL